MKTRFVKEPAEVRRILSVVAAPSFRGIRSLNVTFETDPAVAAELLPPPLAPASEALVMVSIYDVAQSNCVGPFRGASVDLACRFEGQEGLYCLAMPMSTDTAVIFGRELYAEPKKLADIRLDEFGGVHLRGTVTRRGIAIIEVRAQLPDGARDVAGAREQRRYHFKFLPAADGSGFAASPELIEVTHHTTTSRLARGTGTLIFRESGHDPLIDIPVLSVTGVTYSEGDTHTTARLAAPVDPEAFLPYAFGKVDDLTVWADLPVPLER